MRNGKKTQIQCLPHKVILPYDFFFKLELRKSDETKFWFASVNLGREAPERYFRLLGILLCVQIHHNKILYSPGILHLSVEIAKKNLTIAKTDTMREIVRV